ncbi:MAG: gamma carbonic anhydrase family protein [Myxococcota bacterium]
MRPALHESVFVAEGAVIVGDVEIGERSSVWYQSVVRGDVNFVRIGRRTNLQDGCLVHVHQETHPCVIGDEVTAGHHVILHGCTVRDRCLIGIGAAVLDGAVVGEDAVVAAGSLVTPGATVPAGKLAMGRPARVVRDLTEKDLAWIRESAANYAGYAREAIAEAARGKP